MHHRLVAQARALGFPCFPCNSDKTPMTKRGFRDATRDVESLSHLFCRAALIGVPTGAVTGFDVLDIDLQAKQWWGESKWRIPATRTHRTRSGGLHLFFVHEEGLRNTAGRIARGVDTRADGGSIIWWPGANCPVISNAPIAKWPPWLLDAQKPPVREGKCFTPSTDRYARAALSNAARRVAKAGEGTRNHTLNAQTFCLARFVTEGRLSVEEITETMADAARDCGLPQVEALRTIASALKAP